MKNSAILLTLTTALGLSAGMAMAQSAGEWTIGVGIGYVDPKSDNGSLADGTLDVTVGSSARPTITAEYFFMDNVGVEILAATPFKHSINIDGLGKVGSTEQLPPVISVQYHFANDTQFTPFVGLGLNYTMFFSEKATGALKGSRINLDNSWGAAGHVGVDYAVTATDAIRVDARYIDIDTDVKLNGTKLGSVAIDPWVFGASWVHKF